MRVHYMILAGAGTPRHRKSAVFQFKSVPTLLGPDPPAGPERVCTHTHNGTVAKIQKGIGNAFFGQKVPDRFQGKALGEAPEIEQMPTPGKSGFVGFGEKFVCRTALVPAECRHIEIPVGEVAELLTGRYVQMLQVHRIID